MYLHSYRLQNYRRLRDVHVELAHDISIFVGANNSGKTSATHAIRMMLGGSRDRVSLFDFSSHAWTTLRTIGAASPQDDAPVVVPSIVLDLWFGVSAQDLHLTIPLLPSTQWQGTQVGIRIEFGVTNAREMLQRYRARQQEAQGQLAAIAGGAGAYVPWPATLTDYLERELRHEFEFRYFVLDRSQFDAAFVQRAGYTPTPLPNEPGGNALLRSLVRVDFLDAQRHLSDPSTGAPGGSGRSEDLSRRLSRFYQHNLTQHANDYAALKALFDSEDGLNRHLMRVFEPTLRRIAKLGYPGLRNPKLEIKSALNPATVLSQDARVQYVLGDGANALRLPDSYNGLGFKNLIYMVVEILDLHTKWVQSEAERAPLHLIFIEEPEAHLHAQLQQVFIRNVLRLLEVPGETRGAFSSQVVVTTHSAHILYERGFAPIRYFRRHAEDGEQTTQVLNLSTFQSSPASRDRDFLQRYLKLTHCDLFFSDAAILVEGNVERLLLPLMIEREAPSLRSASLCILEVGGAFGHRFKELLEFLGLTTLIVTDIDSVVPRAAADVSDEDDDAEELESAGTGDGESPQPRYGTKCLPTEPSAVTSNQTLVQWLPRKPSIAELLAAPISEKEELLRGSTDARVRVTYQTSVEVQWRETRAMLCGRTLEEAFGLENAAWCQAPEQRSLGLRLRREPPDAEALAAGLHKRVTGQGFDKTRFALGVLERRAEDWTVPFYIKEGLLWLAAQIDYEAEQEELIVADSASSDAAVAVSVAAS
jgi:predicted ATP-dependent endonuclease of OLD family